MRQMTHALCELLSVLLALSTFDSAVCGQSAFQNHFGRNYCMLTVNGSVDWSESGTLCSARGTRRAAPMLRQNITERLMPDIQGWMNTEKLIQNNGQTLVIIGLLKPRRNDDWEWVGPDMPQTDFDDSSQSMWFNESSPNGAFGTTAPSNNNRPWFAFLNLTKSINSEDHTDLRDYAWHWASDDEFRMLGNQNDTHQYVLCEMPWEYQVSHDYKHVLVSGFTESQYNTYLTSDNIGVSPLLRSEAQSQCETLFGTPLASIHLGNAEASSSMIRMKEGFAWIGLNDLNQRGRLENMDLSAIQAYEKLLFRLNETSRCLATRNDSRWLYRPCELQSDVFEFFCNLPSDEFMRRHYPLATPTIRSDGSLVCSNSDQCAQSNLVIAHRSSTDIRCSGLYACDSMNLTVINVTSFTIRSSRDTVSVAIFLNLTDVGHVNIHGTHHRTFYRGIIKVSGIYGSFLMQCHFQQTCFALDLDFVDHALIGADSIGSSEPSDSPNLIIKCFRLKSCDKLSVNLAGPFAKDRESGSSMLRMSVLCQSAEGCPHSRFTIVPKLSDSDSDSRFPLLSYSEDEINQFILNCTNDSSSIPETVNTCFNTSIRNFATIGTVQIDAMQSGNDTRFLSQAKWDFGQVIDNLIFRCNTLNCFRDSIFSLSGSESGNLMMIIESKRRGSFYQSGFDIRNAAELQVLCGDPDPPKDFHSCRMSEWNLNDVRNISVMARQNGALILTDFQVRNAERIEVKSSGNVNSILRSNWKVYDSGMFLLSEEIRLSHFEFYRVSIVNITCANQHGCWKSSLLYIQEPMIPIIKDTNSKQYPHQLNVDCISGKCSLDIDVILDDTTKNNNNNNDDNADANDDASSVNDNDDYYYPLNYYLESNLWCQNNCSHLALNVVIRLDDSKVQEKSKIETNVSLICQSLSALCNGISFSTINEMKGIFPESGYVNIMSDFQCRDDADCSNSLFQVFNNVSRGHTARIRCNGISTCDGIYINTHFPLNEQREYLMENPSSFELVCDGIETCMNSSIDYKGEADYVTIQCIMNDEDSKAPSPCEDVLGWPLFGNHLTWVCKGKRGCPRSDYQVNAHCFDGSAEVVIDGAGNKVEYSRMTFLCPQKGTDKPSCILSAKRKAFASNSEIIATLKQWNERSVKISGNLDSFANGLSSGYYVKKNRKCDEDGNYEYELDCRTQYNGKQEWIESEGCSSLVLSIYDPASLSILGMTGFCGCLFLLFAHYSMKKYNPRQFRVQFGLEMAMYCFLVSSVFFVISTFPMLSLMQCRVTKNEATAIEECSEFKLSKSLVFRISVVMSVLFYVAFLNFLEIQAFNVGKFNISWKYMCATDKGILQDHRVKHVAAARVDSTSFDDFFLNKIDGFQHGKQNSSQMTLKYLNQSTVQDKIARLERNSMQDGNTPRRPDRLSVDYMRPPKLTDFAAKKNNNLNDSNHTISGISSSNLHLSVPVSDKPSSEIRMLVDQSEGWTPRNNWFVNSDFIGPEFRRRMYLSFAREFFDLNANAKKEDGLVFVAPFPLPTRGALLSRMDGFGLTGDEVTLLKWKRRSLSVLLVSKIAMQMITAMIALNSWNNHKQRYTSGWIGRLLIGFCWLDIIVLSNTYVILGWLTTLSIWLLFSRFSPLNKHTGNMQSKSLFEESVESEKTRLWCDVSVLSILFAVMAIILSVKGRTKQLRAYKLFMQFLDFSTDLIVLVYWALSDSLVRMSILLCFLLLCIIIQYWKVFPLLIHPNNEGYWAHVFILVGMGRGWAGVKLWNQGHSNGSDIRWYRISASVEMIETCYESYPSLVFGLYIMLSDPRSTLSGPLLASVMITGMVVATKIVMSSYRHIFCRKLLTFHLVDYDKQKWFGTWILSLFAFTDFFVRSVSLAFLLAAIEGFNGNIRIPLDSIIGGLFLLIGLFACEAGLMYYAALKNENDLLNKEDIQFIIEYCMPTSLSITPLIFSVFAVYPFHRHSDWLRVLHTQYIHIALALFFYLLIIFWRDAFQVYPELITLCLIMLSANLCLTCLLHYVFVDCSHKLIDPKTVKRSKFDEIRNKFENAGSDD